MKIREPEWQYDEEMDYYHDCIEQFVFTIKKKENVLEWKIVKISLALGNIPMRRGVSNSVEEAKADCCSSWKDLIKEMFLEDE